MRYQDYRSNVQDILDNIKSDQNSLNLGAVAILSVLDMAMLNKDEEELEDAEEEYEGEDEESEESDEANSDGDTPVKEDTVDKKSVLETKKNAEMQDNVAEDKEPSMPSQKSKDESANKDPDNDKTVKSQETTSKELADAMDYFTKMMEDRSENEEKTSDEETDTAKELEKPELPKVKKVEKPKKQKKIKPTPKVKTIEEEYGVEPGNKAVIARRDVRGVRLHDAGNGELVGTLNEEATRRFNIGNGSMLEVQGGGSDVRYIRTLTRADEPEDNEVFKFGVVKSQGMNLYVEDNASGQKLGDLNPVCGHYHVPTVVNSLLADSGFVREGDIVDLAWSKSMPENIQIRWVYKTKSNMPLKATIGATPSKALVKASKPKPKEESNKTSLTTLDFNLRGKQVIVVIGNEVRSPLLKKMISAHGGRGRVVDAFKFSNVNKYWKKELRHADIVVMVQNLNTHATSKTLQKYVKQFNLGFAIADSAGILSVERAIYRAYEGLPTYETSTQPIVYPVAN